MWADPAVSLPVDGQAVWVRLKLYSVQTPLQAVYVLASHSFTMPNGLLMSWEWIARWKAR